MTVFGAPRKAPGGLTRALYVRIDQPTLDRLDAYVARLREDVVHCTLSRADVVRRMINEALERSKVDVQ